MTDIPLTHIIVKPFGITRWNLLLKFLTRPDGKHKSGGFQNREAKWRSRLNEADHSIELDADDIGWIQHKIINCNGGWQAHLRDIFAGQHPAFSGLRTEPRPKREQRKKRGTDPGLLP